MPRFECRQCNRQFTNDYALQQHRQYSPIHLILYPCASCNRSFKTKSGLNTHIQALHTRYRCTSCNRSFKHESALNSHTQALHTRYSCPSCNRSFKHEFALNDHFQALHRRKNKPYRCTLCSRSFGDQSALGNHTQALHYRTSSSSAHDFGYAKCPFCPSYFTSPSALAHHIESGCHGITRHQVTHVVKRLNIVPNICIAKRIEGASPTPPTTIKYYVAPLSSFNGRAYACFLCKRMFRSLSSLSDHLNSAAHDANEFKCPKCKKRFKLISALIQHIESAACKIAGLQQVQTHFQGLIGRFSRLISL